MQFDVRKILIKIMMKILLLFWLLEGKLISLSSFCNLFDLTSSLVLKHFILKVLNLEDYYWKKSLVLLLKMDLNKQKESETLQKVLLNKQTSVLSVESLISYCSFPRLIISAVFVLFLIYFLIFLLQILLF
jgi:hypothetical protein